MCKVVEEYAQEKVIEAEKRAEMKAEKTVKQTALSLIRDGVSDVVIRQPLMIW